MGADSTCNQDKIQISEISIVGATDMMLWHTVVGNGDIDMLVTAITSAGEVTYLINNFDASDRNPDLKLHKYTFTGHESLSWYASAHFLRVDNHKHIIQLRETILSLHDRNGGSSHHCVTLSEQQ